MNQVERFQTTFFWPLVMEVAQSEREKHSGKAEDLESTLLAEQFKRLVEGTSGWKRVADTLLHLPPPTDADQSEAYTREAYAEFLYFHDFVQKSLFGSRSDPNDNHPLMLLQRTDITAVDVEIGDDTYSATVERLNLYLIRPGIAVLALQVSVDQNLSLGAVQKFNDLFRRSHLPFLTTSGAWEQRPHSVTWKTTDTRVRAFLTSDDRGGHNAAPRIDQKTRTSEPKRRQSLPYRHWRWLITGNDPASFRFSAFPGEKFNWRHFSDERLPILTTFVMASRTDYYQISEGDWSRITFVDRPGNDPLPYAAKFLRERMPDHVYDRYHHPKYVVADAPTRFLMCDYALTAVTYRRETRPSYVKPDNNGINTFAANIEMHMQRHYYQMFLLCVIDKAVMLNISSRISGAVEAYDGARMDDKKKRGAEDTLAAEMEEIERDFLHYVHRFRFTGISGQLQPSEMYAQLRKVMNLDELYDDTKNELETAVEFLSGREAKRAADATERLNVIATIALVLGLVMAFFSMNIITDKDIWFAAGDAAERARNGGFNSLAGGLAIASLVTLGLLSYLSLKRTGYWREHRFYPKAIQIGLAIVGGVALISWLFEWP